MLTKEATETLDFQINWADWLGALTISSSAWTVPSGITEVTNSNTTTTTLIRLSGGTWAESYELVSTITASNGEIESRSLTIKIQRSVAYCSTSEFRRRATQATVATLPNPECEALIEQASRFFDRYCGVPEGYFNPPLYPVATDKIVYGDGTNFLRLPPYVTGSLDTNITFPSGYTAPTFIERDGYLILSSTGVMTHRIAPFPHPYYSGWYSGVPITVSAKWGFEETPADVKLAVIELAINLWRETDPASLKLVSIDNQPLRESIPPRVAAIAKRYRVREVAFA